jgi:hypothetical protein
LHYLDNTHHLTCDSRLLALTTFGSRQPKQLLLSWNTSTAQASLLTCLSALTAWHLALPSSALIHSTSSARQHTCPCPCRPLHCPYSPPAVPAALAPALNTLSTSLSTSERSWSQLCAPRARPLRPPPQHLQSRSSSLGSRSNHLGSRSNQQQPPPRTLSTYNRNNSASAHRRSTCRAGAAALAAAATTLAAAATSSSPAAATSYAHRCTWAGSSGRLAGCGGPWWNSDTAIPDRGHSRCCGRATGCCADLWSLIVRTRYHLVL